ncbi:metallopeptidase family protein [Afifella marina]|uniref:Predicted Zn-dependent protease, minimal metalloprotease (MMP)-like domain n=1 Tax=Afifella marina DSM 2698 TaxID=1120955 RepID=A0A1G5NRY7_AFIMA|nr:metallopeptidase family protein [Afifella marina]MBK1624742.1 Zn-dependent protease [Afifella marina DSM 2698]MBK1628554.1 Zn-dependent protease [Afifella marina]MBK5915913.1 Zn-dependent protease [Afifella marina]RAI20551.1 Zn-dependent protease [Afifella marina DSM 2698]SCZ39758.1 Predicted Zn-dependent protease, minimal metalloprotease (MMP)-like domain [Afifella marina DSM 2698]
MTAFSSIPDLEEFERIALAAYDGLPEEFRALTGDIQIRVAERADRESLAAVGLTHPLELLGLFEGIGLAHAPATPYSGLMPNRVWLYRQAILAYWQDHDERLEDIIAHVLVHEIGHHFGLSDDDMEEIEAAD